MLIQKVTDPAKKVTDPLLLRNLAEQGIDKDYVEFFQDYAPRSKGKEHSPYAKFYRDLKSGKKMMVVSGLPKVKPDGTKIEVGWLEKDNKYKSKANLFSALVDGTQVEIVVLSDQPSGAKKNDKVTWQPQLFLDGMEQFPLNSKARLVDDPTNENYHLNVLEWDYGICKRRIRIIEGRLRERWVFPSNPGGDVLITHNQQGALRLKFGLYRINDDEELVPVEVFNQAEYPFDVGASATFYPDAHVETSSVDGVVIHQNTCLSWANIRGGAGTHASDDSANSWGAVLGTSACASGEWFFFYRGVFVFDTSGLPDAASISAATFSIYGTAKQDPAGWALSFGLVQGASASNTALVPGDFALNTYTTRFATDISYANFDDSGWNDWVLNANGIANISKTGVSKFSLKHSADIDNSEPSWSGNKTFGNYNDYAEEGTNKPRLVVTYTAITEKTSSDTGSGAESLVSRLFGAAETGSGVSAASLLAVLIGTGETGLGSELAAKIFSALDAGSGFDALKALIEVTGSDIKLPARPGQVRIPSKEVNL